MLCLYTMWCTVKMLVSDSCVTWALPVPIMSSYRDEDLLTLFTLLLSWARSSLYAVCPHQLTFLHPVMARLFTEMPWISPNVQGTVDGKIVLFQCQPTVLATLILVSFYQSSTLQKKNHLKHAGVLPLMRVWWTWVSPVEFSSALWCGHGPFLVSV